VAVKAGSPHSEALENSVRESLLRKSLVHELIATAIKHTMHIFTIFFIAIFF
jgi:hypothetical protein